MLLLIKVNHQEGSDCGESNTLLGGTAYRQRLMTVKVCGKGPSTANNGRQTTGPPGQLHCISISLLAFCFSYACQFDNTADRKGHKPAVYLKLSHGISGGGERTKNGGGSSAHLLLEPICLPTRIFMRTAVQNITPLECGMLVVRYLLNQLR